MTLFLLALTIITCTSNVDSAFNVTSVTSCTSHINDQCKQNLTSCPQPPCSLSCGRTSPQFSCSQDCIPTDNLTEGYLCNTLECQASQFCYQTCSKINCNSSTCTSKDCKQQCWLADCGKMACKSDVTNCNQVAVIPANGQVMNCEAQVCNQECKRCGKSFSSNLTCSSSVESCEQRGLSGKFNLKCLPGVKNCTQKADLFSIANMECNGVRCVQSCFHSNCNMNCSSSVRECTQSEDGFGSAVIIMNCDADVCRQDCGDSRCNMTCKSTVKECTQTCKGTCAIRCDAEICNGDATSTPSLPSHYPIPTNSVSKMSVADISWCLFVLYSVNNCVLLIALKLTDNERIEST